MRLPTEGLLPPPVGSVFHGMEVMLLEKGIELKFWVVIVAVALVAGMVRLRLDWRRLLALAAVDGVLDVAGVDQPIIVLNQYGKEVTFGI